MRLGMRWFGPEEDRVPLAWLRQVPGLVSVVTALHGIPAGEPWPQGAIDGRRRLVEGAGLAFDTIESVNVHEDIKLGLPPRDRWAGHYAETLRRLGRAGVRTVCYNFMPVFDWLRTDLAMAMPDGSTTLAYRHEAVRDTDPDQLLAKILAGTRDFAWPGWEAGRLSQLAPTLERYKGVDADKLWENLAWFLGAVCPAAEEAGIRLAIHPDDPPWPIFGLPRIITGRGSYLRLLECCPSPANGITLCAGSLGSSADNDVPALIREFGHRIYFVHARNVRRGGDLDFHETAHRSGAGSLDMRAILCALRDIGYGGVIRPDHGRMIWGEAGRPGYGLHDRALGLAYLAGLIEGIG